MQNNKPSFLWYKLKNIYINGEMEGEKPKACFLVGGTKVENRLTITQ